MRKPTAVAIAVVSLSLVGFLYVLLTAGWAVVDHPLSPSTSGDVESISFAANGGQREVDLREMNARLEKEEADLSATVVSLSEILEAEQAEISALLDLYHIDASALGLDDRPLRPLVEDESEGESLVLPFCSPSELKHFAAENALESKRWRDKFLKYKSDVPDHLRLCEMSGESKDVADVTVQEVAVIGNVPVGSYIHSDQSPFRLPPFMGGNPNSRHCMALVVAGSDVEEAEICTAIYQTLLISLGINDEPGDLDLESLKELNDYLSDGLSTDGVSAISAVQGERDLPVVRVAASSSGLSDSFFGVYVCNRTIVQVLSADAPAMSENRSLLASIDVFLLGNSRTNDHEEAWASLTSLQSSQLSILAPNLASVLEEGEQVEEEWAEEEEKYVWEADREEVEDAEYEDELESPFGGLGGSGILALHWNRPDATYGHLPRIDLALSGLTDADIRVTEVTPALEWFRNTPLSSDKKHPVALVMSSASLHCETIVETVDALQSFVPINVFAIGEPAEACARHVNADLCTHFPDCCSADFDTLSARLLPMAGDMAKEILQEACVAYHHKFTLVIDQEPWVNGLTSSRLWQTLAVGTVPVYMGSRSISNLLPVQSSVIQIRDFESYAVLGRHLIQSLTNTAQYESMLAWRQRPFSRPFLHAIQKGCTSSICTIVSSLSGSNGVGE